jgi:hypothetical protein
MNAEGFSIDCDFPGGNIVVDGISGDVVDLHQDLRDTPIAWFYWYFRVRGAAGRTLTFRFTQSDAIGVRGPAVSTDGGAHWAWLGAEAVEGQSFRFTVPSPADDVRFSFTIPYLEAHLHAFLGRHAGSPYLRTGILCQTNKGRAAEFLKLGQVAGAPAHRVLLTARHHACESMATFSLEGLLEEVLAGAGSGRWLRENVEFLVIPFVDKDGVEDGDQGKRRNPYDHWEDYGDTSIYPTVRAIKQFVPQWAEGRLRFALDLHCPWIRGGSHEVIHFVGSPNQEHWRRVGRFCDILERVGAGPLPYHSRNNLPFGVAWNVEGGPARTFERWGESIPGVVVSTLVEIPYANVEGTIVTPESARAFGRDLAQALCEFLQMSSGSASGAASEDAASS